jgi:hypothetical protein
MVYVFGLSVYKGWWSPLLRQKRAIPISSYQDLFSSRSHPKVGELCCYGSHTVSNMDQIQNLLDILALRPAIYHLSQNSLSLSQDARIFENHFKATLLVVTLRDGFLPALIATRSIMDSRKIKWWVRKTSTSCLVYHAR